jgi:hypothetical protein
MKKKGIMSRMQLSVGYIREVSAMAQTPWMDRFHAEMREWIDTDPEAAATIELYRKIIEGAEKRFIKEAKKKLGLVIAPGDEI